jgi:hypothetical protein
MITNELTDLQHFTDLRSLPRMHWCDVPQVIITAAHFDIASKTLNYVAKKSSTSLWRIKIPYLLNKKSSLH